MEIRDYCDSMYAELTGMKARLYDILRVIERMPREEQAKIRYQTDELDILVGDLSRKIDQLLKECPADWSKAKEEIETIKDNWRKRSTGGTRATLPGATSAVREGPDPSLANIPIAKSFFWCAKFLNPPKSPFFKGGLSKECR